MLDRVQCALNLVAKDMKKSKFGSPRLQLTSLPARCVCQMAIDALEDERAIAPRQRVGVGIVHVFFNVARGGQSDGDGGTDLFVCGLVEALGDRRRIRSIEVVCATGLNE